MKVHIYKSNGNQKQPIVKFSVLLTAVTLSLSLVLGLKTKFFGLGLETCGLGLVSFGLGLGLKLCGLVNNVARPADS